MTPAGRKESRCVRCNASMTVRGLVDSLGLAPADVWERVHSQTFGRLGLVLTTQRAALDQSKRAFDVGREVERELHVPSAPLAPVRPLRSL